MFFQKFDKVARGGRFDFGSVSLQQWRVSFRFGRLVLTGVLFLAFSARQVLCRTVGLRCGVRLGCLGCGSKRLSGGTLDCCGRRNAKPQLPKSLDISAEAD
ncbi:MAG: hypothetical protein ACKERG_04555 [Candidatus Hodgkinia cicadicola]